MLCGKTLMSTLVKRCSKYSNNLGHMQTNKENAAGFPCYLKVEYFYTSFHKPQLSKAKKQFP